MNLSYLLYFILADELDFQAIMNDKEPSSPPVPYWGGHFKLVQVGDIKAVIDAPGRLYYDAGSQRLRLFDENRQIRLVGIRRQQKEQV